MATLVKVAFCFAVAWSRFVAASFPGEETIETRALPSCPKSVARNGCLTHQQAEDITHRWAEIFNLDFGGDRLETLVNCTTAPQISTIDKTYTFGNGGKGQLYGSRKRLFHMQNSAYKGRKMDPIQQGRYHTAFRLYNCDHITWRWFFNGTTSGIANPPSATNKVKGKPVVYFGTDILFLDKDSFRINHVVTSGDWYNMFFAVGMSFDGTSLCPGT